ncbi:hypothetical protein [Flavobacterium sp.]|jgi:hypothetical protein|uniref:hypothetical protein n=1 Tax=Flavobacterium sp. TaxID=239 RepID=UPI002A7EC673|nr:hypothetical protein [Flavobacterium sp.]
MSEKEIWRERWLVSINELTSIDLQKKSWLMKENENPHWSFIEFTSCYFDDLCLDDDYLDVLKSNWVSTEEFEILKNWHFKLKSYNPPNDDCYNHELILKDINWIELVESGKKVRVELLNFFTNPEN